MAANRRGHILSTTICCRRSVLSCHLAHGTVLRSSDFMDGQNLVQPVVGGGRHFWTAGKLKAAGPKRYEDVGVKRQQ